MMFSMSPYHIFVSPTVCWGIHSCIVQHRWVEMLKAAFSMARSSGCRSKRGAGGVCRKGAMEVQLGPTNIIKNGRKRELRRERK